MRRNFAFVATGIVAVLGTAGTLYFVRPIAPKERDEWVESAQGPELAAGPAEARPEPLFPAGGTYRRGRSGWFHWQFAQDRRRLLRQEAPRDFMVAARIHREPFSSGGWLVELSEAEREERLEVESHGIEVLAAFTVEGIRPLELLLFLACADYCTRLPEDPAIEFEYFLPGQRVETDCFPTRVRLGPDEVLTHEHWKPMLVRKGNDVWFLNRIGRDGECWYYLYEVWRNCPRGDEYAPVRLSSGQYAVVERGGDCLVKVHSYYSGQKIPPLMDALICAKTEEFYRGLATTIRRLAPRWNPPADVREWKETLSLE